MICKLVVLKENIVTHSFQNHCSKHLKHPSQSFPYEEIKMSH